MPMTPMQYADVYRNLPVYLYTEEQAEAARGGALPPGGSWETVDVHSYRINLKQAWQSTQTSLEVFKSRVRSHLRNRDSEITIWVRKAVDGGVVSKTYRSRIALAENVNDPFYGKGSPEECQVVLQLAVRYGVIRREQVQLYCNNGNIGLDCNGFVGNYLRHVVQQLPWDTDAHTREERRTQFDANTLIQSIVTFSGMTAPMNSIIEMEASGNSIYILAMCDQRGRILDHVRQADGSVSVGHIMISEPGHNHIAHNPILGRFGQRERALSMQVIESTGGMGLVRSEYLLLPANEHGVFHAFRGSKQSMMYVRAARLLA